MLISAFPLSSGEGVANDREYHKRRRWAMSRGNFGAAPVTAAGQRSGWRGRARAGVGKTQATPASKTGRALLGDNRQPDAGHASQQDPRPGQPAHGEDLPQASQGKAQEPNDNQRPLR